MSTCGVLRSRFVKGALSLAAVALVATLGSSRQPYRAQAAPPGDAAADACVAMLLRQSISPDLDGIVAHLRSLTPGPDARRRIRALIAQLGDASFDRREAATRELIALPIVPVDALRRAARSDEAEQRMRAARVLASRSVGNSTGALATACFRTLTKKRLTGGAAAVLETLPLFADEMTLSAGREALKATCAASDAGLLRAGARRGASEARVGAVGALAVVLGDAATAEIAPLMSDREPRVKLAAARALADRGDRAALAPLVDLLCAPDVRVRYASAATLRALTGRQSDFAAWVEPDAQPDAIRGWQTWLARDARTARLTYPVRPSGYEFGRTLLCVYAKNEIVEVDAAGRQTLAVSESGGCPWACQGLSSGGRLVALYSSNAVVEYAADGRERARFTVPSGPMSVQRLDNGNTLVACNNAHQVVEVDDQGKIAWEVRLSGGPCDAVRLENGHTLVTLQNVNAVVELDPAGREVWKIDGLHTPRTAARLENGNTLVCDLGSGRVIEFDRDGREAWSQGGFSSPFGAQRLSTGTTLISDTTAVTEIDRDGKVVSENKQGSLGRVFRY
jgi:hypothetical protein